MVRSSILSCNIRFVSYIGNDIPIFCFLLRSLTSADSIRSGFREALSMIDIFAAVFLLSICRLLFWIGRHGDVLDGNYISNQGAGRDFHEREYGAEPAPSWSSFLTAARHACVTYQWSMSGLAGRPHSDRPANTFAPQSHPLHAAPFFIYKARTRGDSRTFRGVDQ